jgi:antirestriction protein ArdC
MSSSWAPAGQGYTPLPWNTLEQAAGKISRPLRHNGIPYSGVNTVLLWSEAMDKGYNAPIWMTFRQAKVLGAHVRKGEKGTSVAYANKVKKTKAKEKPEGDAHDIFFMKDYTVFEPGDIIRNDYVAYVLGYPGHQSPHRLNTDHMFVVG